MITVKNMGVVYGSESAAKPLIIGKDTVYVHTNIKKVSIPYKTIDPETNEEITTSREEYEYEEIQYTYPEFLQLQADSQSKLQESIQNTQLAMLELYENMG